MRIGSLFSGFGGLELGLELAGLGETIWQVEQDELCRRVLTRHWPDARRYVDVRDICRRDRVEPVDLICGGFPCQDVSVAGKRAGLAGARSGLWYEFARIAEALRPEWLAIENVASGANRWVDAVRGDLERIGYASLPVPLGAWTVGAPHARERVFIVGRLADASRERHEARHVDSGQPQEPEPRRGGRAVADAGLLRPEPLRPRDHDSDRDAHRDEPLGCRAPYSHRFPPGPLDVSGWAEWLANDGPEPAIRRGLDGISDGLVDSQLHGLGNAVVPQCAEVVGWVIRHLITEPTP